MSEIVNEMNEVNAVPAEEMKKPKKPKDNRTFFPGLGRRKSSVARVRIASGTGTIMINKREFKNYFPVETHRINVLRPLVEVGLTDKIDVIANIAGGGLSGQASAMRLGIARALNLMDAGLRAPLKKAGYLTRDSRIKERKKYGRKRARKRFQFSKR